jgi:hypothetical protein
MDSGFKTNLNEFLGDFFEAFLFKILPVHWYHLLCLKHITGTVKNQFGILHKFPNAFLSKWEKSSAGRSFALTAWVLV